MKRAVLLIIMNLAMTVCIAQQLIVFNNGCSYFGESTKSNVYVFDPGNEAKQVLARIMKYTGLPQNFILKAADVANAEARMLGTERYILYNQGFMKKINEDAKNDWAAISILAHEIGHHLSNHPMDNANNRHEKELEADTYSGYVLFNMGASIEDAMAAINTVAKEEGTPSHPPKSARKAAITKGWMQAHENATGKIGEPQQSTDYDTSNSSPVSIYYFRKGYHSGAASRYFKTKDYRNALKNFKECLAAHDSIIKINGVGFGFVDSFAIVNATFCTDRNKIDEEAAIYFEQISDRPMSQEAEDRVYKWLTAYYRKRCDIISPAKYLLHGTTEPGFELYYATTIQSRAIEAVDRKYYVQGKALMTKAIEQAKSARIPSIAKTEQSLLVGELYFNLGVLYNIEKNDYPSRPSPTQVKEKQQLQNDMYTYFREALPWLENVETTLSTKGKLQLAEKFYLRNNFEIMSIIYSQLGQSEKCLEYETKRATVYKQY